MDNLNSTLPIDSTTDDPVPAHHANPVVAFIIGLAIILLASLLNAAGLNLTKFDHVRTSAIPKASRKKDWLRPLWLLGMLLYIISQLIGSTLALEYMRAEYVAPLGSSSLVFNFLFARFLVGTPVTSNDIYGTIVVVIGVIGIVAFGSINSGLASETDVTHLTYLWRRGGWLGFFFFMAFALGSLLLFTSSLDAVLAARSDLNSDIPSGPSARNGLKATGVSIWGRIKEVYESVMKWINERLELWTAPKDDKQVAWTLGIGWACCGGGLAGGCLVFAKATVKLISGSLSHENTGNQFGHAAPIFTFLLLACTAVLQIICLNRGLKVYDSTLVVPVFYGVYTATGFLDSLIFNDEVDSYKPWTLFMIFVSIMVLISGVVLLTHKKPERSAISRAPTLASAIMRQRTKATPKGGKTKSDDEEEQGLRAPEEGEVAEGSGDILWQVGDASDDEDGDDAARPENALKISGLGGSGHGEEGQGLMTGHDDGDGIQQSHGHQHRRSTSSDATLARRDSAGALDPFHDEEFGDWKAGR